MLRLYRTRRYDAAAATDRACWAKKRGKTRMAKRQYWLVKTEPQEYSIDDLQRDGRTSWAGVRNYQARNFMRDEMKVGDLVLVYHSNAEPTGIAGIARVSKAGHTDT